MSKPFFRLTIEFDKPAGCKIDPRVRRHLELCGTRGKRKKALTTFISRFNFSPEAFTRSAHYAALTTRPLLPKCY